MEESCLTAKKGEVVLQWAMNTDGFKEIELPNGKDSHTMRVLGPAGRCWMNGLRMSVWGGSVWAMKKVDEGL